jgi:hypothetical protein
MSEKNLDYYGRFRSVNVSFRVSPEEGKLLNSLVKISGMTKQDYITEALLSNQIIIQPTSRTYKAIKDELSTVISELKRIEAGQNVDVDLLDLLSRITSAIDSLKEA